MCRKGNGLIFNLVPMIYDPLFCKIFRLDGICTNKDATKYSIKPITTLKLNKRGEMEKDEYMTYHQGIEHKFPGYKLDENHIVVNVSDVTIDLEQHCKLLLSKRLEDIDLYNNKLKGELFGGQAHFLSGKPLRAVSYTSYPRSGNTFLRKYLENITSVATGSD